MSWPPFSSPQGTAHPFQPQLDETDSGERIVRALEHITVVLSAVDNNLVIWINRTTNAHD
jgi:hypothetical protein